MSSSLLSLNGIPLYEQWGDVPDIDAPFDEMGDYKHRVIVQHLPYFQRQDGDHLEDIIDQCVFDSQTSTIVTATEFYDAHQTEQDLQPTPTVPEDQPAYISMVTPKHDPDFRTTLKKAFKSPHPAPNVHRPKEALLVTLFTPMSQLSMMDQLLLSSLLGYTRKKLLMCKVLKRTPSL
jgi:hypothetical protein